MCVCVCLGSMCLKLLLRDDFKILKCWLGLWLSCILDCIYICVLPFLKSCFLSQSRHLSTARWIDRETFCLLDSFSTPLDRSRSSCMHCFSHVLHLFFILSSRASCFITFMHFYGFFVPPLIILDHLFLCFLSETF